MGFELMKDKMCCIEGAEVVVQVCKSLNGHNSGDAGYRSRYLSHAKRALFHLSYTP
uniref:Uncharacterized protein n=1 Tax=Physcomitrium patens TaxID=3218 RepID=A0A2K1LBW3_PHYPA|nr:hypothetical protein PHYPA_001946 [Physcomitrium patens]